MPSSGVLFSLAAYLLYSCCDAIIKGFGTGLSPFEIAFWTALFSFLPAIFTKPKGEHWRHTFQMHHPWLVNLRSLAGVVGNLSIIYAFTHIPLAEAYSLAFLAPIFAGAPRAVWEERLARLEVPHSPVYTSKEVVAGDLAAHHRLVVEGEGPRGTFRTIRFPVRFDGEIEGEVTPPPELGADNAAILGR